MTQASRYDKCVAEFGNAKVLAEKHGLTLNNPSEGVYCLQYKPLGWTWNIYPRKTQSSGLITASGNPPSIAKKRKGQWTLLDLVRDAISHMKVPPEKINTSGDVQRPSVDWTRAIERISGGEAFVLSASHDKSIINIAHRLPGAIGWLVFNGPHERACQLFRNKPQPDDFPFVSHITLPHIMAKGKPLCFRNTWGSDSAVNAAGFVIDATRAAETVAKERNDLPLYAKVVDVSHLPENQVHDNAEAQSAEAAIDWKKDVQIAGKDETIWTDFTPVFVNKNHVYGHSVYAAVEFALIWPFSDWRFRNKPALPKVVKGTVEIHEDRHGNYYALFQTNEEETRRVMDEPLLRFEIHKVLSANYACKKD